MYEPYGEEKKKFNFKEKFNRIKEKFQGQFKDYKFDKITVIMVALSLLFITGSITGYISYTGRINDLQSENVILEKQKDSLETQFDDATSQLSTCNSDLESSKSNLEVTKGQLTKMTLDYQTVSTDLQVCNDEKLTLASDLNLVNEELKKKKEDYDKLKGKYNELEDDLDTVTCNYAKIKCGAVSDYYYLDDGEDVVCCWDSETCKKEPDSGEEVKEITC
ncbi:MAG: hypothetical protein ISS48_00200 [Candidatus Aenigmarchaeota archaeon]|nr:hypothetical protein [Candidatus Aenigmarchaeota archaeon]